MHSDNQWLFQRMCSQVETSVTIIIVLYTNNLYRIYKKIIKDCYYYSLKDYYSENQLLTFGFNFADVLNKYWYYIINGIQIYI